VYCSESVEEKPIKADDELKLSQCPVTSCSVRSAAAVLMLNGECDTATLPLWLQQQLDRSIAKHLEKRAFSLIYSFSSG